jgi:hypothetical protein
VTTTTPDPRITPAEAAAVLALDNKGSPSVSPTARRRIYERWIADRLAECASLRAEVVRLKDAAKVKDRRISDLELRLRGVSR